MIRKAVILLLSLTVSATIAGWVWSVLAPGVWNSPAHPRMPHWRITLEHGLLTVGRIQELQDEWSDIDYTLWGVGFESHAHLDAFVSTRCVSWSRLRLPLWAALIVLVPYPAMAAVRARRARPLLMRIGGRTASRRRWGRRILVPCSIAAATGVVVLEYLGRAWDTALPYSFLGPTGREYAVTDMVLAAWLQDPEFHDAPPRAPGCLWYRELDAESRVCVRVHQSGLHMAHLQVSDPPNVSPRNWEWRVAGLELTRRATYRRYSGSSTFRFEVDAGWRNSANSVIHSIRIPLWAPFVFFLMMPVVALVRGPLCRYVRRHEGYCANCCYNLRGNITGVCPECGEPTPDAGDRKSGRRRAILPRAGPDRG